MTSVIIDVKKIIDDGRMAPYQWLVLGLCLLIMMLDGIDSAAMGFVAPPLMKEWHITRMAFGSIMSAAMFGFAAGALLVGPYADRLGRRKVLIPAVFFFGFFSLFCAFAQSPDQLMALRFLTGIGLGAAMPNSTTLLSEYVPARMKSFLITVMFAGFNLGSGCAGFLASLLVEDYGWRGVLFVGGALPLLSIPLLLWLLPESAKLLVVQKHPPEEIAKLLNRVCGGNFNSDMVFVSHEPTAITRKIPVFDLLFRDGYAFGTLMLWVSYFMGLLILYLITGWLPTLITGAGYSVEHAASVTAMFQLGSTAGAIIVGVLMDRLDRSRVVAASYLIGGICVLTLGTSLLQSGWLPVQVAVSGFFLGGAQTGLNALAPAFYPTRARATGVSWMNGIGRCGAIMGSLVGGMLLSMGLHFGAVFSVLAMPALLAAASVILNRFAVRFIACEVNL